MRWWPQATMMLGLVLVIYGQEARVTISTIIGAVLAVNGAVAWLTVQRQP